MNDEENRGLSPVLLRGRGALPSFAAAGAAGREGGGVRLTRISRPVATRFAAVFPSGSGELAGRRRQGGEGGQPASPTRLDRWTAWGFVGKNPAFGNVSGTGESWTGSRYWTN